MASLYTEDVRRFIYSREWPTDKHGDYRVKVVITEASEPEPHLNIIFFRDNWLTLTFDEQAKATSIVKEIMAHLWGQGIPTYVAKMESRYEG